MNIDLWKTYRSYKNFVGKCYDQQYYRAILEAYMVSTTEGITESSPMSISLSVPVKNQVKENHSVNF